MKSGHFYTTLALIIIVSSCSDGGEDTSPDCSSSDLSVEIANVVDSKCESLGSLTLSASGGVAPYTYSLDGFTFQENNTFDELSVGSYSLTVMDQNECKVVVSGSVGFDDGGVEGAVVSVSATSCGAEEGTVELSASGGSGTYQFMVDDSDYLTIAEFTGLSSGSHTYVVKDSEGCSDEGEFQILTNTSLETDIMPIIETNCAVSGCHGTTQIPLLTSSQAVIANAEKIETRTSARSMPPEGRDQLTQAQIDLIACWVNDGASNN